MLEDALSLALALVAVIIALGLVAPHVLFRLGRTASRRQKADECIRLVESARRAVRSRDAKAHGMAVIHMRRVRRLLKEHGLTIEDIGLSESEARRLENGRPDDFFFRPEAIAL